MNIVANLIARIESARAENKNPCKSYSTEANAEKVAAKTAQDVANYFHKAKGDDARSMRYVVVFVPSWGRWVCGFDMSELINRSSSTGGYLGICGDHFTY